MDRDQEQPPNDIPLEDKAGKQSGETAKKALDEIPPPGTDPLHEGP